MFSFFRKNNNNSPKPEWASFFTDKEYAVFIEKADNYFKKLKIEYQIFEGYLEVDSKDFGFERLGLTNVAQVCKHESIVYYGKIISAHFDSMKRANRFDMEFNAIVDDFEQAKKYIGVRLYDNEYIATVGKENTVGVDITGDIYAMLVFDLPDSVINIKPEQTEKWNKTKDYLFNLGIANIKDNYSISISEEQFDKFNIWFVQSDVFFTGNIIFELDKNPKLIGKKGSLIGLPHRHAVLIYPINSLETITTISILIPMIYGMNQEGPGSLSNNLIWYFNGKFTNLPYKMDNDKLEFSPTESFLDILNEFE